MRSTAIVLWLMILLVFVPIGAAHLIASLLEAGGPAAIAAVQPDPGGRAILAR